MRLLLVEDEPTLAAVLKSALRPQFIVDVAQSCTQARELFELGNYAVILLDVQLGDGTGLELCQTWRKQNSTVPVIFLTGAKSIPDIIKGLSLGADDYLTKPFDVDELKARLQAVLRRSSLLRPTQIHHGNLLLDAGSYQASYNHHPIRFRPKEWQILELLLRHPGQVVTYAMIWEHVWERSDQINSNTLEVHLSQLRQKLAKHSNQPLIETVKPLGYRLIKSASSSTEVAV